MKLRALLIITSLAIALIPVAMITGLQSIQIATAFLLLILLVTFAVSFIVSHYIARPLATLTRRIDQISRGDLDVQLDKSEIDEINRLTESLDRVMASLKLAIHKVGVKKEEIFEEAIKAREQAEFKYRQLTKTLDGWIWEITTDGHCSACTEKVAAALGQPASTLIGKDLTTLLGDEQAAAVQQSLTQHSEKDTALTFEHTMTHADGHPVHIQTQVIPLKDADGKVTGLYCYSRDVTDMHTALAQMEGLHEKLLALNNDVQGLFHPQLPTPTTAETPTTDDPSLLVQFTDDLRIVDCSTSLAARLGIPRDEMLSAGLDVVLSFPEYDAIKAALENAKDKGTMPITLRQTKPDGSTIQTTGTLEYIKDKDLFQYRPNI